MVRILAANLHCVHRETNEPILHDVTGVAVEWLVQGRDTEGPYLFLGTRTEALLKKKYKKNKGTNKALKDARTAWESDWTVLSLEVEFVEASAEQGETMLVKIISHSEQFWVRPELVKALTNAPEKDAGDKKEVLEWCLDSLRALWFESAALGDVAKLQALRKAMGARVGVDAACGASFTAPKMGGVSQPLNDPEMTGLMLAAYFAHQEAVVELLAQGADLNCVTGKFGDNAFMYACKRQTLENLDLSRYLLTQVPTIDIQHRNRSNGNLILHAAANGNLAVVKLLCMAGLDPFERNCRGRTPLDNIRYSLGLDYERSAEFTQALKECEEWLQSEAKLFVDARAQNRLKIQEDAEEDFKKEEAENQEQTSQEIALTRLPSAKSRGRKKKIFLSYCWDNQDKVLKLKELLVDALPKHLFEVWLDLTHMSGSTMVAMAEAVETADLVLMAVSSGYQKSKNCRYEGEYSCMQGKKIIPVMMEKGFKPSSWLGLMCGAKLYFSCHTDIAGQIPALKKEILTLIEMGEQVHHTALPSIETTPTAKVEPSLVAASGGAGKRGMEGGGEGAEEQWSVSQVKKWAAALGLRAEALKAFQALALDGVCLVELARAYCSSPNCPQAASLMGGGGGRRDFWKKKPLRKDRQLALGSGAQKAGQQVTRVEGILACVQKINHILFSSTAPAPWYVLVGIGLSNGSGNFCMAIGQPHTPGLTQSLLMTLGIPLVMLLSLLCLGKRSSLVAALYFGSKRTFLNARSFYMLRNPSEAEQLLSPHDHAPASGRPLLADFSQTQYWLILLLLVLLLTADQVLVTLLFDEFTEKFSQFVNQGTALVYIVLSSLILLLRSNRGCCRNVRCFWDIRNMQKRSSNAAFSSVVPATSTAPAPWYVLVGIGLFNGSGNFCMAIGQPHTPGLTQSLLMTLGIPLVMLLSLLCLGKRSSLVAVAGAFLIASGIGLSALRGVFITDTGGEAVVPFWYSIALFAGAQLFLSGEKVWEEHSFSKFSALDPMWMFWFTLVTQFILGWALYPLQTFPALGNLTLSSIPSVIDGGVRCTLGQAVEKSAGTGECSSSNTVIFFVYCLVDFWCYFFGLYVIQLGGANLMVMASAISLPLTQIFLCSSAFVGEKWAEKFFWGDAAALSLVMLGFGVYQFSREGKEGRGQ